MCKINLNTSFKVFIIWLFLIPCCISVDGQDNNSTPINNTQTYLTARYHTGIVLPHHTSMAYLIEDYSRGFDVTLGRSSFGKDNWEKYFNYPELGIGLFYGTLGNKDVFGNGIALYPYVNFNIYRTQHFTVHYKVALGIGYATKPFDIDDNLYNAVFGSHLNAYVSFGLMLDYRVIDRISITSALSMNHMSNGGIKKPNYGINTATLCIGTKYHFNKNSTPPSHKIDVPKVNQRELLVVGFAGYSQGMTFTPNYYWSWGISSTHLWLNTVKQSFGIGLDVMYFGAAPYMYKDDEKEVYTFSDSFYGGMFLAYQKNLGKATMYFNLGYYIFEGVKPPQPIYPRLGLRYAVTKKLQAHFGIKAYFFTAEYLEFGLGYKIAL